MSKYLGFVFLVLLSLNTSAQNKSFELLLIAGANASQVNGDKLAGFDKFGLNVGAGVRRSFSERAAWQIEFLYSEKGSKDVVTNTNPVPDTLFQFNYVDIPIIFSYRVYKNLDVEAGIFNSVRVKALYSDFINDFDRSAVIRPTDHGLCLGLNYQLFNNFDVNARVSQSVFDINATIERYFNLYTSLGIRYRLK